MSTVHRLSLSSSLAATFLLAILHMPLAAAQDEPPPWVLCGTPPDSGFYKENTTYQANIERLSTTVPKSASVSPVLFATASFGAIPDIVYALALCRGDSNASACEACLGAAFRAAPQRCPLYKDVFVFYDACHLRFSNRNFLASDDNFVYTVTLQSSERVAGSAAAEFDATVGLLVNATADYAAANSSRRFGTGEEGFDGKSIPTIYAMSQCAPTMAADKCRSCLADIFRLMPAYFSGRKGGGILGVWCSYRYEVFPFFSGRPLLQLPVFSGMAPAPPATILEGAKNKTGSVLAIAIPVIAVVLIVTVISFCYWRRRPAANPLLSYSISSDDIQSIDSLILDLSTLRVATDGFDETNVLGKGGFGMVYKGVLPDGQQIAVKRLCQSSSQGIGELKSELVLVAKLHHRNLVRLIGVCLEEQEKILVYEYMPNRSLDTILFDSEKSKELDWGSRFKIISGIARGLQYLHEDSQLKIVHRDLKASNILLDLDYNPKVSDFGLAKIFGGDQSADVTYRIAGTYGYMAPEYAMRGQYSIKSDAFSFGVLVFEIVTGRRNNSSSNSEQYVDLLNLVWDHWTKGNVMELIDPSLGNHLPIEHVVKCIQIGLWCVQKKPADRPLMSSVNVMLSSHTVRVPPVSRPAFCIQEISASDSSNACTDNSKEVCSSEVPITVIEPR